MGIAEALYLDMGRGWNYGWYRPTPNSPVTELFDYKSPHKTNRIVIRLQGSGQ